jgi:hypothetical protein
MNAEKMTSHVACLKAHVALWENIPIGKEGIVVFLERLTKIIASELLSITNGDGKKASQLLDEGVVQIVEKEIAYLANDPEVKEMAELMGLFTSPNNQKGI